MAKPTTKNYNLEFAHHFAEHLRAYDATTAWRHAALQLAAFCHSAAQLYTENFGVASKMSLAPRMCYCFHLIKTDGATVRKRDARVKIRTHPEVKARTHTHANAHTQTQAYTYSAWLPRQSVAKSFQATGIKVLAQNWK